LVASRIACNSALAERRHLLRVAEPSAS
jgi:hypothetical protein